MKTIVTIARILVGSLFIVSGLIKANDALGFSYKLEEYFSPKALDMPFFEPWALELAIVICVAEILLGVAVLLGAKAKLTSVLLLLMILFFTWLTFYTATCDPHEQITVVRDGVEVTESPECVLECGCFGNAIPLTPWESFTKDVILLVLIVIIFIGTFAGKVRLNKSGEDMVIVAFSLLLIAIFSMALLDWLFPVLFTAIALGLAITVKRRLKGNKNNEWFMAISVILVCGIFQYYTLAHLPIKDYRPYAEGKNIREQMKSAEELGKEPPVYAVEYTFTNTKTGEDTIVLSNDYLEIYKEEWFKSTYENKSWEGPTVTFEEGYTPPISDFEITTRDGSPMTEELINGEEYIFLVVAYDIENADTGEIEEIAQLAEDVQAEGHKIYGLTSSNYETTEQFRHDHDLAFEFLVGDGIVLKTMIRANPGIMLLKDGKVIRKWHNNDTPTLEQIKQNQYYKEVDPD
ncbi:DoxX family protein [Halocola ammonii]